MKSKLVALVVGMSLASFLGTTSLLGGTPNLGKVSAAEKSKSEKSVFTPPRPKSQDVDSSPSMPSAGTPTRVLIIGSSVARGWVDKGHGGYLGRAFHQVSKEWGTPFQVYNQAMPGKGCLHIVNRYPTWLNQIHPQIVVIAWGSLDDLHDATPMTTVEDQVKWEIQSALDAHAVVFLATPLVSGPAYGVYKQSEPDYISHELAAANSFNSPNVYEFDLFDRMKGYIAEHRQDYQMYMHDAWHPNTLGHTLAGQLFAGEIEAKFPSHDIEFTPATSTTPSSTGTM